VVYTFERVGGYCDDRGVAIDILGPSYHSGYIVTLNFGEFNVCEDDAWTRVAIDEEEGRVAIGRVDGTIMVFEYA